MPVPNAVDRLARQSTAASKRQQALIVRLILALLRIWSRADVWSGQSVAAAAALSSVAVVTAQRQARVLAQAKQAGYLELAGGVAVPGEPGTDYPRFGVNAFDVWNRPARAARVEVASGSEFVEQQAFKAEVRRLVAEAERAVRAGAGLDLSSDVPAVDVLVSEVQELAEQEIQLAGRDETDRVLARSDVTFYRRILHPELSKSGPCGLCFVAATQKYRVGGLLPIHDRCKCDVAPIVGRPGSDGDPGLYLNKKDFRSVLDAMYGATTQGTTDRGGLSNVRALEVLHDELGPRLTEGSRVPEWAVKKVPKSAGADQWRTMVEIAEARSALGGSAYEMRAFDALKESAQAQLMLSGKG